MTTKAIAYFLGFGYIALGSVLILYTRQALEALKRLTQAFPLKVLSPLPAFFGLLFLISASATTFPWFLRIVGLLALCKAVLVFANPHGLYTRLLNWYFGNVSDQAHRLYGIIAIIFGTAMLTWIK